MGYRCKRNGVIGGNLGAVTLRRIKAIDNGLAGIEIEKVVDVADGIGKLEDSLVVGRSSQWDGAGLSPHGVITPRTDMWTVSNIRFFNFDWAQAAALGTCSHCYFEPSTDSDARTVKTERLAFTNVNMRIRYQYPFKGILWDQDGTLTNLGAKSWATAFWKHNAAQSECQTDRLLYDGIICNNSVQVRRIVLYGYKPSSLDNRKLFILPYDDSVVSSMTSADLLTYEGTDTNGSLVDWLKYRNPEKHWTVPYVTGKKYYLRWAGGLDFDQMTVEIIPSLWSATDGDVEFEMPHYDMRHAVYVDNNLKVRFDNETLTWAENNATDFTFGDNLVRNITKTRRINLMINGDNKKVSSVTLTGVRCIWDCAPPVPDVKPPDPTMRLWSRLADWEGRATIPLDGENVVIPSHWNMFYDIPVSEAKVLRSVEINGKLTFLAGANRELKVYNLWVRSGELNIGNSTHPFPNKATITLQGDNTEEFWAFTSSIEAGNKNLVVTGNANLYGRPRDQRSRLQTTVYSGMDTFFVSTGLDWAVGEQIVLAPSNMRTLDTDICVIAEHSSAEGKIRCASPLNGYHFGDSVSSETAHGVDMRTEVALLSRDIEIGASQHDISHSAREPWGCRILVSDFFEQDADMTMRVGSLRMDHVSVHRCG